MTKQSASNIFIDPRSNSLSQQQATGSIDSLSEKACAQERAGFDGRPWYLNVNYVNDLKTTNKHQA